MVFQGSYQVPVHYRVGDVVIASSITFVSRIDDNQGNQPLTSPNAWTPFAGVA